MNDSTGTFVLSASIFIENSHVNKTNCTKCEKEKRLSATQKSL